MVKLVPMTEQDFGAYLSTAVREYAEDRVRAGLWPTEGALERSAEEHRSMLPQGPATPGHHLFVVLDAELGVPVGALWLGERRDRARAALHVFDLVVDPVQRGRGHGRLALLEAEEVARRVGLTELTLRVAGDNPASMAMCAKAGFATVDVSMRKPVPPRPPVDTLSPGITE